MGIHSEAEMQEAGFRLGILERGQPIPPRLRGKLAKVVELAKADDQAVADRAKRTTGVVDPIVDTYSALVERGVPDPSAARIVAALAPQIWRDQTTTKAART